MSSPSLYLRLAEPWLCGRCASLPARRSLTSVAKQPLKHEIRSRPIASSTSPPIQSSQNRAFSSSKPWAAYKTVQEAKTKYRLGVCLTIQTTFCHTRNQLTSWSAILMASRTPLRPRWRRSNCVLPL
nr:hypothetical protein CFP56_79262 [Quercus suber]